MILHAAITSWVVGRQSHMFDMDVTEVTLHALIIQRSGMRITYITNIHLNHIIGKNMPLNTKRHTIYYLNPGYKGHYTRVWSREWPYYKSNTLRVYHRQTHAKMPKHNNQNPSPHKDLRTRMAWVTKLQPILIKHTCENHFMGGWQVVTYA